MQELIKETPDTVADFRAWVRRAADHIKPLISDPDESDRSQRRLVARVVQRARFISFTLKFYRLALRLPEGNAMTPLSGWLYLRECARFRFKRKPPPQVTASTKAYTVKQTADVLAVSERTIYDLIQRNEIGHHRVGSGRGRIRIRPSDIEAYQMRSEIPKFSHLFRK